MTGRIRIHSDSLRSKLHGGTGAAPPIRAILRVPDTVSQGPGLAHIGFDDMTQ
jgi:hypothetical protein